MREAILGAPRKRIPPISGSSMSRIRIMSDTKQSLKAGKSDVKSLKTGNDAGKRLNGTFHP